MGDQIYLLHSLHGKVSGLSLVDIQQLSLRRLKWFQLSLLACIVFLLYGYTQLNKMMLICLHSPQLSSHHLGRVRNHFGFMFACAGSLSKLITTPS